MSKAFFYFSKILVAFPDKVRYNVKERRDLCCYFAGKVREAPLQMGGTMKKLVGVLICCLLVGSLGITGTVFAQGDSVVIGDRLIFEEGNGPIIMDSRLLLPLRAISEALDATVYWFGDAKRIQIVRYDSLLSLQIGNNMMGRYAIEDGKASIVDNIEMDVPATIQNDRTYVPLRAISEAFDAEIQWDNPNRTAVVIPKAVKENKLSLRQIISQPAGVLSATTGVITRDSETGLFYLRSLQIGSSGDYERVPLCTPTKTSISDQTAYGEYISAYWLEQFGTENPSGLVVQFTGITHVQDGITYLVVNKTTTGVRSLGYYDLYMDSLGLHYTAFDAMRS